MRLVDILGKFLAKCVSGATGVSDATIIASAIVAQALLEANMATLVLDLRRIKESFLQRIEARTDSVRAEAELKLAEAANATNKITPVAHEQALRLAQQEAALIENEKRKAEASMAGSRAKLMEELVRDMRENRLKDASLELMEALTQYMLEGGQLHIDSQNLKALIQAGQKANPDADGPDRSPK
jgi:hypothetical protein